jgi:hypothetical protein
MQEISKDIEDAIDQAVFEEFGPDTLASAIKTEFAKIISGRIHPNNPMENQEIIHRLVNAMNSGEEIDD